MVRAAARGVVDFHDARPLDPYWWRRLNLLLDEVETEDTLRLAGVALRYHMLTAANANLTEGAFKSSREAAHRLFKVMDGALRPWNVDRERGDEERDLYKKHIGDYRNDPAVKAAVEAEAKAMRDAALAGPDRTDDQLYQERLERRIREHRARQRRPAKRK